MATTLTTVRDQLETRLSDSTNLIFATAALDESLRAALADLSLAYGEAVYLKDLDSALLTTFDDLDLNTLIVGAMAYACRSRTVERFEDATPAREHLENLAAWADQFMNDFMGHLTQIRLRKFQESANTPYDAWDWEEGTDFA